MPSITRASFPTEFYDITSAKLLVQPEPQYLHANMWMSALMKRLNVPGDLGLDPSRALVPGGATVGSFAANQVSWEDPVLGNAFAVVPELGNRPGHTVRINRPIFANTAYTELSRQVTGDASISTTPINISNEQVAVTLKRFAGPYDSTNSNVAPFGIDRFDASLAIHDMAEMVGMHLQRDFVRFIDAVLVGIMDGASATVYPTGMSAVDDATNADAYPLDFNQLTRVELQLHSDKIPKFPNGKWICMITPRQKMELANDPTFQRLSEFHPQANPVLAQSYYRSCGSLDIHVSQTLNTTNNSSSVAIQYGQAFGPGVLGCGIGDLPRVAHANEDNYGETAKVIWLLYAGWSLLDNRFVVSVRSS